MERDLGQAVSHMPGAGAAGGLGAGVLAFLGGKLRPGIELLLDAAHFDQLLEDADLVLTGEGRMDGQTVHGKTPGGAGAKDGRALHRPVRLGRRRGGGRVRRGHRRGVLCGAGRVLLRADTKEL